MISLKRITLLSTLAFLPGCSFFGAVSQSISDIVAENADRPYFAYSLRDEDDTDIYLATITKDRKGLGRDVVETEIGRADLFPHEFSSTDALLSVAFAELLTGEIDLGTLIIDVEAREVVGSFTDTTMAGYMQLECGSELAAAAQVILNEEGRRLDRELKLVRLEYNESFDEGFIAPDFWVNDRHLVAAFSLPYSMYWIDQNDGTEGFIPFTPMESSSVTGQIDLRRNLLGSWRKDGCGSAEVAPTEPAETAQLRATREGVLTLDGEELENALTVGFPLQSLRVLDATKWTFPF